MLIAPAIYASTYVPTDGTVNFLTLGFVGTPTVGIFDDSDITFSGGYLAIDPTGDQANFTASGSNFLLTSSSGTVPATFMLAGSSQFSIAARATNLSPWKLPDGEFCSANSASCFLTWSALLVGYAVDLTPVAPPSGAVPIPSPVMLLASGLVGLVAVMRIKPGV